MRIDGQCHCGYVRYEADIDPTEVSICHCTDCQSLTGSACRVTVAATRDRFTLRGNAPKRLYKGRRQWHGQCAIFLPEMRIADLSRRWRCR